LEGRRVCMGVEERFSYDFRFGAFSGGEHK